MDSESSDPLEVPALGRNFGLGMLYDCRYDVLVTEPTVWSPDELTEHVGERSQAYNDIEIVASDSIDEKSSALNVDASVKASLLFGLIKKEGSAKYLDDRKKSKNQARVTLSYKVTTKVKELSINHLIRQNKKYSEVIDKGLATHVVTAILYGAQAFFVFDHKVSEEENNEQIQCELKLFAKNISSLECPFDNNKVSCTFHGDIHPEKLPTSFKEAIEVYQGLPKLLGPNGEKAVPIKVWLLPLASLDPSAAKLIQQISVGLVQECQSVLEDFNEIEMRWNDAINTTAAEGFPQIKEKIEAFKESCSDFKVKFQETLANTLPSIRKGREGESELAKILTMRHSSPFNIKSLSEWMDRKEREIYNVMCFTKMMMINTKIIPLQDQLNKEICSPDHVVCFVFTSLGRAEPYLSALSDYLKGTTKPDDPEDPNTAHVEKEPWYASADIAETKKRGQLFSDFAEANKENKNIKFLIVGLTNETRKGSTIYLYKDGRSISENFEPPSKPETVTVGEINHNSVTLKISPPRFGEENVTSYSVEYCVSEKDGWQQKTESKAEEVTVSDLRPNTEYKFRCRAVTSAGVGPANEVSDSIKTLPCYPPGEPHVKANSCEISVSWEKPAELGQDVQISSYILEYAKTDNKVKEELKWKQIKSTAKKATISELQSKTEYAVRVRCDCGEAGRSKESNTVYVSTKTSTRLSKPLKEKCERINRGSPSVYKLPLTDKKIKINGCKMFNFGEERDRENHTIVLLGATGSGKSTLINGMMNYIVGLKWKENFRFKLITEDRSEVTVYKINHQEGFKIDYSLTIVDIPGFGDTRDTKRDKLLTERLCTLFSAQDGIKEVDAVCFVAPAASTQLTAAQKYVFESVLPIFGKDVVENIRVLVTFADGQRPPVLEAIRASNVPCPKTDDGLPVYFKFNNSVLFAHNKSSGADNTVDDDGDDRGDSGGGGDSSGNGGSKSADEGSGARGGTGSGIGKSNNKSGGDGDNGGDGGGISSGDNDGDGSGKRSADGNGDGNNYGDGNGDGDNGGDGGGISSGEDGGDSSGKRSADGNSDADNGGDCTGDNDGDGDGGSSGIDNSGGDGDGGGDNGGDVCVISSGDGSGDGDGGGDKVGGGSGNSGGGGQANQLSVDFKTGKHDDEDVKFDQIFWNMGRKSIKEFFAALKGMNSKTLTISQDKERLQLKNDVENAVEQIKSALAKLEEIKETTEKLKRHEAEINRNKKFEFEVTVMRPEKCTTDVLLNCQQCHVTCPMSNDANQRGGDVFGSNGCCIECPGECHSSVHCWQDYMWEYKEVTEKQTLEKLKKKLKENWFRFLLEKISWKTITVQGLIEKLEDEYKSTQDQVVKLMEKSVESLNKLKEIATKPKPLSTLDHFDLIIKGEESEKKSGWEKRVQFLETTRKAAEEMAKANNSSPLKSKKDKGFPRQSKDKTTTPQQDLNQDQPNKVEVHADIKNETEQEAGI